MKVLFLVEADPMGASARYRVRNFLPQLRGAGIESVVLPAVGAAGSKRILHRLRIIRELVRSDVVFIQRHLYAVRTLDLLAALGRPIIYDFDDALHVYPTGQAMAPPPQWKQIVVGRLRHTIERASHVIAGNSTLGEYAQRFNDRVTVIPTSVPCASTEPAPGTATGEVVVGWIGRGENLAYLKAIGEGLRDASAAQPFTLRIVCNEPLHLSGLRIDNRTWSLATEDEELSTFDIGIAPLVDDEWSRGKCGLKALQVMALGRPVVVSPVAVQAQMVRHEENGVWAQSPAEWAAQIRRLLGDPALRARLGRAAWRTVAEHYSVDANGPHLIGVLRGTDTRGRDEGTWQGWRPFAPPQLIERRENQPR